MSARTDGPTEALTRAGNLPAYVNAYTSMFWSYLSVNPSADTTTYAVHSGNLNNFDLVGTNATEALRLVSRTSSGAPSISTGTTIVVGVWNHICLRRTGTGNVDLMLNGVVDINNTLSSTGRAGAAAVWLGLQVGNNAPFNGRIAYQRDYSTNLSDAEVVTEMDNQFVQRTSNLINDVPLETDAIALTGTNYTEVGTITYEDDPPFGSTGIVVLRRRIEGY